ncbi:MAG: 6-phosphofructokinase [Rubricoccaceae bacterium]
MLDLHRIGVFTSGGDAPGMNACIRAAVRRALAEGLEVIGIRQGYQGMVEGDFVEMDKQSVSNILQQGGTILKSARSEVFRTPEGRAKAAEKLADAGITALVAIGGDGTLQGATHLQAEHGVSVIGCPGTIDNDLFGTDETIGFDTALNTALDSIDKIRDTADAHNRLFLVEVMGRDTGFIALSCGIGGGAELVLIPEMMTDMGETKDRILSLMSAQQRSSIVVVAEGDELGGAHHIAQALREDRAFDDIDTRVSVLGHIQRGGSPTARDRVLASRLGAAAVEMLLEGHTGVMVGVVNNDIKLTPMKNAWSRKKDIDYDLLQLTALLS